MTRAVNFDALVCGPDIKVSEALARIDRASPNLFQIVVRDAQSPAIDWLLRHAETKA